MMVVVVVVEVVEVVVYCWSTFILAVAKGKKGDA